VTVAWTAGTIALEVLAAAIIITAGLVVLYLIARWVWARQAWEAKQERLAERRSRGRDD
jgi:hypothetical protein